MQLFTIGLYKMNIDGTAELDSSGNPIATYTNKDITEYSKVYTGFHRRKLRSNIEDPRDPKGWGNNMGKSVLFLPSLSFLILRDSYLTKIVFCNLVDPLQINAEKKDHFPKVSNIFVDFLTYILEFAPRKIHAKDSVLTDPKFLFHFAAWTRSSIYWRRISNLLRPPSPELAEKWSYISPTWFKFGS